MVKTIAIPENNNLNLFIPNEYVGKEIEILFYAKQELKEQNASPKKKPSDFFGTLSKEEGEKMQVYVTECRNEW